MAGRNGLKLDVCRVELKTREIYDGSTLRDFKIATEVMQSALMRAHVTTGTFLLIPKCKHKWKSGANKSIRLRPSQGREVRVQIKAIGQHTVWDYSLTPKDILIDFDFVRQNLEAAFGKESTEDDENEVIPTDHVLVTNGQHIQPEEEIVVPPQPVVEPPNSVPVPELESSPVEKMERLLIALRRRDTRKARIKAHEETVERLEYEILVLKERQEAELNAAMMLAEENANDEEAKLADQFTELLSRFK